MEESTSLDYQHELNPEDLEPRPIQLPPRRRIFTAAAVLLVVILLAVLPPLVNLNRFRRQIATSISQSLGRPVHMGSVTLDILPLPGVTIENFVVLEDPAFGNEPVIHADSVKARLRWRSLWHRRVEFSRISLTGASVNLVRRSDNRWNIESILFQASRIPSDPTAQPSAGRAPRFPYIEATGARLNFKMGLEKMPFSLTEADFALWLPQAEQWRVRLEAHPSRTDTAATDTGQFRLEGTLGKAVRLDDVPIDLQASWAAAPLGAASQIVLGHDAGVRGELTLTASAKGTVGSNVAESHLTFARLRRADFVPAHTLDADIACSANVTRAFQTVGDLHCTWPAETAGDGLVLSGAIPDIRHPMGADITAKVTKLPAQALLDALRLVSPRIAPDLVMTGTLDASADCCSSRTPPASTFTLADAKLAIGSAIYLDKAALTATSSAEPNDVSDAYPFESQLLTLRGVPLDLGAPTPTSLDFTLDRNGYSFHLAGQALPAKLLKLAAAVPQFGDGLAEALPATEAGDEAPIHLDLTSLRTWNSTQSWSQTPAKPAAGRKPRRREKL